MEARFNSAITAIKSGDVSQLKELVRQDPSLVSGRSSTSHPTLLQCLVLDARDSPSSVEMAGVLIDAGAELNGPLVACGSCDNVDVAALLIDLGAAVNGVGPWSPLEEALYWNSPGMKALLLQRGASIHNLRIAAGLGRLGLIEGFFDSDGSLKAGAGKIEWPWSPQARAWANDNQDIINNAFVYACIHGQPDAATLLLQKGAQINIIPGGFDFAGTGLHYAALNGHRPMVEFLVDRGADPRLKDKKVGGTPAGWAEHGGHLAIKAYLESVR